MTLPLPKCAQCGKSLRHAGASVDGRILFHLGFPGTPTVGWHGDCASLDLLFKRWKDVSGPGIDLVRGVLQRGADRVSARKVFWSGEGRA